MKKVCFSLNELAFPVELQQQGRDNFTVVYGKQVKEKLTYGAACTELGAAIMHALACDGRLDNEKGRRKTA